MTDNDIIKGLECCGNQMYSCTDKRCKAQTLGNALDLINRQKAEIERLEYTLDGVMHSVDKWLDGDELNQDEVNRAITMREKTLQIVEKQKAEIEEQDQAIINALKRMGQIRAEAITEFAERLNDTKFKQGNDYVIYADNVSTIAKEMKEGVNNA